ncbi:MAG: heavy-metal-associated domain-containing protein [Pirellulales bacterium]
MADLMNSRINLIVLAATVLLWTTVGDAQQRSQLNEPPSGAAATGNQMNPGMQMMVVVSQAPLVNRDGQHADVHVSSVMRSAVTKALKGVKNVSVSAHDKQAVVVADESVSAEALTAAVAKAGFTATIAK